MDRQELIEILLKWFNFPQRLPKELKLEKKSELENQYLFHVCFCTFCKCPGIICGIDGYIHNELELLIDKFETDNVTTT